MSLNTHITMINFINYSMKTFLNNEMKREEAYKIYHVPPLLQTTLLTMYDQTFRGVARRIFKSRHNMIEESSMRVKRVKAPGESKVEPL